MPQNDVVWVDVLPSMNRFARLLDQAVGSAARTGGERAGQEFGAGFEAKAAAKVAAASKAMSTSMRQVEDATGRVRVAQARLTEVQESGRAKASQLAAAQEAVSRAERSQTAAKESLAAATKRVADATEAQRRGVDGLSSSSGRAAKDLLTLRLESDALERSTKSVGSALGVMGKIAGAAFASLGTQALTGGLVAVAGAASAAAGAVALVPAAVVAAGAPIAAVSIGLVGLADAFKAAAKVGLESGAAARQAAESQAAAARQVRSARESLAQAETAAGRTSVENSQRIASAQRQEADARRQAGVDAAQAAARVAEAERTLDRAQQDAERAQRTLNQARAQEVENLEDLQFSLRSTALAEQEAIINLAEAQDRLTEARARGAGGRELQRLELDAQQASLRLDEIRERYGDLQTESAEYARTGIEGSQGVQTAQRGVADANEAVRAAERGLAEARAEQDRQAQESARQIEEARRGVAEAQAQAAQSEQDASRRVAEAQRALMEATDAAAAAMRQQNPAAEALATALDRLAPSARAFVQESLALKPAFDAMRLDVQQALFAGMSDRVRELSGLYLPVLRRVLTELAGDVNAAGTAVSAVFANRQNVIDFNGALGLSRTAFQQMVSAAAPLTQIFFDLVAVGSTFLPGLAEGFASAARSAADFVRNARETGQLRDFIAQGITVLGQLGGLLGNVGSIIGSVFRAGAEVGGGFIETMRVATGEVARFLASPVGQSMLATFFEAVSTAVRVLGPLLSTVGSIILGTVAPALAALAVQLGPIAQVLLTALLTAFQRLQPLMPQVGAAISAVVAAFVPLVPVVADLAVRWLPPLLDGLVTLAPVLPPLVASIGALVGVIRAWNAVQTVLNLLMNSNPFVLVAGAIVALGAALVTTYQTSETFRNVVDTAFRVVGAAGMWLWENALRPAFAFIGDAWGALATGVMWAWQNILRPAWDAVSAAARFLSENALMPTFRFIGDAWSALVIGIMWAWENVLRPAWDFVSAAARFLFDNVLLPVFRFIGDAWSALVTGIMLAWQNILRPAWDFVAAAAMFLFENVLRPVFGFIGDAWGALAAGIALAWNNVVRPVWDFIATAAQVLFVALAVAVFGPLLLAWEAMSRGIDFAWNYIIKPAWNAVQSAAEFLWNNVLRPYFGFIMAGWDALGVAIRWVYDNIIQPAWNAVQAAAEFLWNRVLRPNFEFIMAGWDALGVALRWVYDNIIQPAWNALQDAADFLWNRVLRPIFGFIADTWTAISNAISAAWNNIILPAWDALGRAANFLWNDILKPVFRFIVETFLNLAETIVGGAARAFSWVPGVGPMLEGVQGSIAALREKANQQFNSVDANPAIGQMNSLRDAVNNVPTVKGLTIEAYAKYGQAPGLVGFPAANGMVVDYYAGGGLREKHVAQIAPAGAWRVWAEPETGGEAYIPLAPSKRAKSLDIWREAGRRIDAPEVQHFARGGLSAVGHVGCGCGQHAGQLKTPGTGETGRFAPPMSQERYEQLLKDREITFTGGGGPLNVPAAVRAWQNVADLDVRLGTGKNPIDVVWYTKNGGMLIGGTPNMLGRYADRYGLIQMMSGADWTRPGQKAGSETTAQNEVLLHEVGHALSLSHSRNAGTLMYPFYSEAAASPTREDRVRLRAAFPDRGEPRGAALSPEHFPVFAPGQFPGSYTGTPAGVGHRVQQFYLASAAQALKGLDDLLRRGVPGPTGPMPGPPGPLRPRGGAYGGVLPHVAAVGDLIQRLFGRMTVGGYANRNIAGTNVRSDHAMGKALDFMTYRDMGKGQRIADYLVANARELRTDNVIWNRRIWSGRGWGPYRGANPHIDHPHWDTFHGGGNTRHWPREHLAMLAPDERVFDARQDDYFRRFVEATAPGGGGRWGDRKLADKIEVHANDRDQGRDIVEKLWHKVRVADRGGVYTFTT